MSVESPTGRVEGVGARRTTDGPALVPAHPLQHPNRPFAAAWRRRRIATASPAPQRGYHGATTRLLRELLRGYYGATTRLLRGYYEATTRLLPGHYQATTRLLQGYYQEPPARHSASGTAAAAPLVCRRRSSRQLGAGVDDPHTERNISMRPFSMCRTSWPTPKTKHATCPCAAGCRWSASQPAHRPRR